MHHYFDTNCMFMRLIEKAKPIQTTNVYYLFDYNYHFSVDVLMESHCSIPCCDLLNDQTLTFKYDSVIGDQVNRKLNFFN